MKRLVVLSAAILAPSVLAHEGHDHSTGVGAVVSTEVVSGPISNRYVTIPNWGTMPEGKKLGALHGDVAVDRSGQVYVLTLTEPGIAVFGADGQFKKFLKEGLSGCHSLITVEEKGQEFLWASQLRKNRAIKLDLSGNIIASLPNEKTGPIKGGIKGLTEVLVGPNGDIYLFTGYSTNMIHRLKPDGTLVKSYGSSGQKKDQFAGCHGGVFDYRYEQPRLLVCDRDGRRMIHLTPDLEWIGLYGYAGMRRPADVDIRGDLAVVAEIEGRVNLMDREGVIVASLLDNPQKDQWATNKVGPDQLHDQFFTSPHGVKFGPKGEIYVSEWNKSGRVVALRPKSR